jgi:hypothetical protein
MMLITAVIATPFKYSENRFVRLNRSLGIVSGMISLAFGLYIAYEMGFVDGLFAHSHGHLANFFWIRIRHCAGCRHPAAAS